MKSRNKKKILIIKFWLLLLWVVIPSIHAMPASDRPFKIGQPNGTLVDARKRGDEHGSWVETQSGHTIAKSTNGYWYYVSQYNQNTPILSATKAYLAAPTNLALHKAPVSLTASALHFDESRLRKGKLNPKVLMILVDFTNWPGTYRNTSTWSSKITSTAPNAKTLSDYYAKASYGAVTITPASESYGTYNDGVVGWLRLGTDIPLDRSLGSVEKVDIIKEAIAAADDYVDYAAFDNNTDGKITGNELAIIVVMAGYEESTVANSDEPLAPRVWGQVFNDSFTSWYTTEGIKTNYTQDWVEVCDPVPGNLDPSKGYTGPSEICRDELQTVDQEIAVFDPLIVGEIHQTSVGNKQAPLGIFAHELGHSIFYLHDLYSRYEPVGDLGGFSLMASGGWGMDYRTDTYHGETPVLPDAWSQYKLGWVSATNVTSLGMAGVNTIPTTKPKVGIAKIGKRVANGQFLYWDCSNEDEYFLMQFRADVGYDKGLNLWFGGSNGYQYPFQSGVAIFHVDESTNNNSGFPKLVDLEEANNVPVGTFPGWQYNDHLWYPGTADQFNSLSLPSSKSNDDLESGVTVDVMGQFAMYSNPLAIQPSAVFVNMNIDGVCN